jgi:hypothetical protein
VARKRTDVEQSARVRGESTQEVLDRNVNELLQETRVATAGVQFLFAFLLGLPFTQRFGQLTPVQRDVYTVTLLSTACAALVLIAPVAFHRVLFRRGQRPWIVEHANRAARAGLMALALTTSGAIWLVFDIVTGGVTASLAGGLCLLFFLTMWLVYPLAGHRGQEPTRAWRD